MDADIKGGAIQHMQSVILQHQAKVTGWIAPRPVAPRPGRHATGIVGHFKGGGVGFIGCHGYFPKKVRGIFVWPTGLFFHPVHILDFVRCVSCKFEAEMFLPVWRSCNR